jgi:hypothetical protein
LECIAQGLYIVAMLLLGNKLVLHFDSPAK